MLLISLLIDLLIEFDYERKKNIDHNNKLIVFGSNLHCNGGRSVVIVLPRSRYTEKRFKFIKYFQGWIFRGGNFRRRNARKIQSPQFFSLF